MIRITDIRKSSTVTHLKLDVNADQILYKPSSIQKMPSSVDKSAIRITAARRTIKTTATTRKTVKTTETTTTVFKTTQ